MKIGRFFIIVLLFMAALIIFGDKGLMDYHTLKGTLTELQKFNQHITEDNRRLEREILLLRKDLRYIELTARKELGMVQKGDIVYRFAD